MTRLLDEVSSLPLAFGGAAISGEGGGYGFGDISEGDAISLLQAAKDMGVKVFDTAPIYGFGLSEQRMGKAFKQCREEVFLVSKSGVTWHENKRVDMTNDPSVTKKMLEQSLRDLDSDYIDLFMIHWPDEKVDIRKPLEILAKAKMEGKIKHIGLCNTNLEDLEKAKEIDRIEVVQSQFNIFEREVEKDIFPYLKEHNQSFMSWGTLDKGILTKRVDSDRKFDKSDCRSWAPWWKAMDKEFRYQKVREFWPLLEDHGHSGLEMAIGHNLLSPEVTTVLCGARNHDQLESLIKSFENLPSRELVDKVLEIVYRD